MATTVAGIAANVQSPFKGGKVAAAFARAMKAPANKGLWDAYDRADADLWDNHIFGRKHGVGAEWDNRRRSGGAQ